MKRNYREDIAVLSMGALLLVAGFGAAGCGRQEPPPAAVQTKATGKTTFIPVEGMSCMVCASRIKKALSAVDGVSEAEVNLGKRRARVRYDPATTSPERLMETINGLGYRAGTPQEAP